ncbi:MAG: hypothetical protein WCI43_02990, partial [Candidatus Firestonebacteria bacterium]
MNKSFTLRPFLRFNTRNIAAVFVCAFAAVLFAGDDPSGTLSFKALRQDGYEKGRLGNLRIEVKIDKTILVEDEKNPEPGSDARGYVLFVRNYLFDVAAYSRPTKEELAVRTLKIFAAPGEYEPLVFSVYPFKTLVNCRVTVSGFKNEAGAELRSEVFEINNVLCRPIGKEMVTVKGEILEPLKVLPALEAGISKTIWINAHPPETASPGIYKGKIIFSPEGAQASELAVELEILPFKLLTPPPEVMNWAPIMAGSWDFDRQTEEFRCLKEHGFTGEITNSLAAEKGDFSKADKYIELAKAAGLKGVFVYANTHCQGAFSFADCYGPNGHGKDMFNAASYEKVKKDVERVVRHAAEKAWPPILFYLTTEMGSTLIESPGEDYKLAMQGAEDYYAAIRKVEGAVTLATFNRQEEFKLHAGLATVDWTGFNGEMFPAWEELNKTKPSWMTFIGIDQRMGHGFYLWKFNFKGVRPWCLPPGIMYPREQGLIYYYNGKSHPSVRMERIREGIDDYKYLYTLKEYIKRAPGSSEAAAAEESILAVMRK